MYQSKIGTCSMAALLTALSLSGVVTAQEPAPQPAAQQPALQSAGQPVHYRIKQLLGTTVSLEGNMPAGTVEDLVFDDNGTVEYLIVSNEGKLVTVPWQAAKFNFEKRTATINITPERFQTIPTYTATQYPAYSTPAYRTQTYQYYGLTPAQTRRINRNLP